MTKLHILGSSSHGNGYVLETKYDALIIEAGVPFSEVKKVLGFDISKIRGVLVSHRHNDHAKYIGEYIKAGIAVLAPEDVYQAKKIDTAFSPNTFKAFEMTERNFGNYRIKPFALFHDVPCVGYFIRHPFCGATVFITDTSHAPYRFRDLRNIIIEANYSDEVIGENMMSGRTNKTMRDRVLNSHLDLNGTKEFLSRNDLTHVNNIILAHLSDVNSDAARFRDEIVRATGKTVWIADRGMVIPFGNTPF